MELQIGDQVFFCPQYDEGTYTQALKDWMRDKVGTVESIKGEIVSVRFPGPGHKVSDNFTPCSRWGIKVDDLERKGS